MAHITLLLLLDSLNIKLATLYKLYIESHTTNIHITHTIFSGFYILDDMKQVLCRQGTGGVYYIHQARTIR